MAEPKPLRSPHPPLFVGGRSVFALRRAARLAPTIACSTAALDHRTHQVIELIAELDRAGVTWTNIPPLAAGPRSLAGHLEYLEWAATEVMPIFRPSVV